MAAGRSEQEPSSNQNRVRFGASGHMAFFSLIVIALCTGRLGFCVDALLRNKMERCLGFESLAALEKHRPTGLPEMGL